MQACPRIGSAEEVHGGGVAPPPLARFQEGGLGSGENYTSETPTRNWAFFKFCLDFLNVC